MVISYRAKIILPFMIVCFVFSKNIIAQDNSRKKDPSISGNADAILSPIEEVILYPNQARIQRLIEFDAGEGSRTILFTNANSKLKPNSLNAESVSEDMEILGVKSYLVKDGELENPEWKKLEEDKQELLYKKIVLTSEKSRWNKDLKGIEEYSKYLSYSISEANPSMENSKNWEPSLELLSKRRVKAKERIQSIEKEEKALEEKIQVLQKQINAIESKSGKVSRNIEISFKTKSKGKKKIRLSYLVTDTGWNVSYGISRKENSSDINIEMLGNIRQETGEDWKQVRLLLSTSEPRIGAIRPPLKPIEIRGNILRTEIVFQTREGSAMAAADESEEESVGSIPEEPEPDVGKTGGFSSLDAEGETVMFRIPGLVDIPSVSRSQKRTIAEFKETIKEDSYLFYPQVSKSAYLTIKAKNNREFPLLKGEANLFIENAFIGKSKFEYTPIGQDFVLGFGKDQTIPVKRSVKNFQKQGGALSGGKIFSTKVSVSIHNQSDKTKKIRLIERIPVSQVEEITVDIKNNTTQDYKILSPGILEWTIELAPRKKEDLILEYDVKTPDNFGGTIYGK